ncbi:putative Glycosyltransferase RgtA/B/C/D-like domain-containing protein [Gammaproteobacteria bacterium]
MSNPPRFPLTLPRLGNTGIWTGWLLPAVLLVLLATVYLAWSWTSELGGLGGDNAFYYLTAQFLSPWGESSTIAEYYARHNPYPPLMPLILALLGGGDSLLAAHLITTGFLILAFVAFVFWLVRLGAGQWAAMGLLLVFATAQETYLQTLDIHSENYLLCICLATMGIATRISTASLTAAALLAGLAPLARSAGMAMSVAFICWLWLNHLINTATTGGVGVSPSPVTRGQRVWFTALVILPSVLGALFSMKVPDQSSYSHLLMNKLHEIAAQGSYVEHLHRQFAGLRAGWQLSFNCLLPLIWFIDTLGLLALLGLLWRLFNRHLDGLFSALYLLLLLAWPWVDEPHRYVFPVVPVLLVQAFLLADHLLRGRARGAATFTFVVSLLFVNAPTFADAVERYFTRLPEDLTPFRQSRGWYEEADPPVAMGFLYTLSNLTTGMTTAARAVPAGSCLLTIKPSVVALYTGRMAYAPPKEQANDADFDREVAQLGCRYFFLMNASSLTYSQPLYPKQRLGERARKIYSVLFPDGITVGSELLELSLPK